MLYSFASFLSLGKAPHRPSSLIRMRQIFLYMVLRKTGFFMAIIDAIAIYPCISSVKSRPPSPVPSDLNPPLQSFFCWGLMRGGGVRMRRSSRDRTRTTREWMAEEME